MIASLQWISPPRCRAVHPLEPSGSSRPVLSSKNCHLLQAAKRPAELHGDPDTRPVKKIKADIPAEGTTVTSSILIQPPEPGSLPFSEVLGSLGSAAVAAALAKRKASLGDDDLPPPLVCLDSLAPASAGPFSDNKVS